MQYLHMIYNNINETKSSVFCPTNCFLAGNYHSSGIDLYYMYKYSLYRALYRVPPQMKMKRFLHYSKILRIEFVAVVNCKCIIHIIFIRWIACTVSSFFYITTTSVNCVLFQICRIYYHYVEDKTNERGQNNVIITENNVTM